jgi:hypothetical protein
MRRAVALGLGAALATSGQVGWAQAPGPVTPTELTYHFTRITMVSADGKYIDLSSQPFTFTFRRSDPDLAGVPLQDVAIPSGRYVGIQICYRNQEQVKLDAVRYDGPDGARFRHGDLVSSTAQGVVAAPATAVAVSYGAGDQDWCSGSRFVDPVCVAGSTPCQSHDRVLDARATDGGVEADLVVNMLVDLFHAVVVDADSGAVQYVPNPFVTLGTPGAAIHMTTWDDATRTVGDVSILFGPEGQLIAEMTSKWPEFGLGLGGMCPGPNAVMVTAPLPDGSYPDGPVYVGNFDDGGTGALQVPAMGGACMDISDTTQCLSYGINELNGFLQPPGNLATERCLADADADPPYLGLSYRHVAAGGGDGSTVSMSIVRVVDPSNRFGICRAGDPTEVVGRAGTCSSQGSPDGY